MKIRRHPDIPTLITCSAGSQPESLSAVVVSHLSMCRECNEKLETLREIGVALFESMTEVAGLKPGAHAIVGPPAEADPTPVTGAPETADLPPDVPWALVAGLGLRLDGLSWSDIAPGVSEHVVPLSSGATGDLRLVQLAPGTALPCHGHNGEELTLVLRGGFHDEYGSFFRGDLADLDDGDAHTPVADPVAGCILLIASDGKPADRDARVGIAAP